MNFRGICGEHAENTIISDSGFITVQSGCTLGNDEFTLITHTVHHTIDERTIPIVPTFSSNKMGTIAIRGARVADKQRPIFIEDHAAHFQKLTNSLAEVWRGLEIAEGELEWNAAIRKQRRESHWLWAALILTIIMIGLFYFFNRYFEEWTPNKF